MRAWFARQTLRGKIQTVILVTTTTVLLFLFVIQAVFQYMDLRQTVLEEMRLRAEDVSEKIAAPLAAGDAEGARAILARLQSKPKIICGQVYDDKGQLFADFGEGINPAYHEHFIKTRTTELNHQFYFDHVCMLQPIVLEGRWLGSLVLQGSLVDLKKSMLRSSSTWGTTILAAWLASFLLSRKFREVISEPIEKLARAMKTVSEHKNYSLRIRNAGGDELGQLADGFNEMLEQIELRDSELILHRDRLDHLAHHDSLTGLPNRLLFNDRLKQAVQRAERAKRPLALIFIDLDRFKNINDTLGHDIGDLMLVEAAHRLEQSLRKSDTIARLGGDEFVVILEEFESQQSVAQIAGKIISELSSECQILEHRLYVTASLGISFYPDNGTDLTTLKRCADIAMFRAKEAGRNNYQFYLPGMGDRVREMLAMESDLREALEKGQLRLLFQPQVSMKTGRVCGAEVLLRWDHPTRGLVLPGEFIPLAEETGLIVPMGEWVVGQTCKMARSWLDKGLGSIYFAVNVSPRQFRQAGLVDMIREALEHSGLPPHLLELEMTETLLMTDVENAIEKMTQLKDLGVQLAIDDFGSGYSSLSYLKHFPIRKLKVGRSFIKDLNHDKHDLAIAASVASLARVLGLEAHAEGVESRDQERALLGLGIEWAQGFLYEKPLAAEQFEAFLDQVEILSCEAPGSLMSADPLPGLEKTDGAGAPLILVADPERDFLAPLAVVLRRMGYDVMAVRGLDETLGQARCRRPQVVILAGGPEGQALFRDLRGDPVFSALPVIMVADGHGEDCRQLCAELGRADCLNLPVSGEDLCRVLERCTHSSGRSRHKLRVACEEEATLYRDEVAVAVKVLTLSEGGAYVSGGELLEEGCTVQLRLALPGNDQCLFDGSVLYVNKAAGRLPPGAAIRFRQVASETADLLRRKVEELLISDLLRQQERVFTFSP